MLALGAAEKRYALKDMSPRTRIMYMEYKGEDVVGPARIGKVTFTKTGKSVYYKGRRFTTLSGRGFKANALAADRNRRVSHRQLAARCSCHPVAEAHQRSACFLK